MKTLVEKDISDLIAAALASLGIEGAQIISPWATVAAGEVRNVESADAGLVIEVTVGNRLYDSPQQQQARWQCSVALTVRDGEDPTGRRMLAAWSAISALLQSWQDDLDAAVAAFSAASFDLSGFRLDGGPGPQHSGENKCWTVDSSFTVQGSVN